MFSRRGGVKGESRFQGCPTGHRGEVQRKGRGWRTEAGTDGGLTHASTFPLTKSVACSTKPGGGSV